MKKYTHVKCMADVIEEGIEIFKKGKVYKITGFDYSSLVYYVEPEYYEENLPDEFVIMALDKRFEFFVL